MRNIRILILGSDRRMHRLIRRLAERIGFESVRVAQKKNFQDSYIECTPDCIFLDLGLIGIDHGEILNFLAEQGSRAMLIVMGVPRNIGDQSPQALGESLGLNMQGSLSDEFSIDDINAKLEQIRRVEP